MRSHRLGHCLNREFIQEWKPSLPGREKRKQESADSRCKKNHEPTVILIDSAHRRRRRCNEDEMEQGKRAPCHHQPNQCATYPTSSI
ncbi:hypothetical protein NPIL_390641 [Nephila pilipes]|uniref:Uncharacterized protein n=1 Tax=Nephila pilipes TaxID=299642 RepID=A0A8X6K573_NEPPI|nr:hypothetical protein NPIL_390641 [Nephila pilipes]